MKKIAACLTLLVVLTACGGGGGRPSTDDIAKALKDKDNAAAADLTGGSDSGASDKAIDCLAKALHDSDLSDGALNAIVKGDEKYKPSSKDEKVASDSKFIDSVTKCFTS